ncbi:UNVERIFIED_CONTAM: hypothetical protein PYX00_004641 [Menopon gallinae]
MGHDHHELPPVPDFRKYNVDDVPILKETQRKLAFHGLRDPWLRNEVWKYQIPGQNHTKYNFHRLKPALTGFKYGLALALIMTAISKTMARKIEHHH